MSELPTIVCALCNKPVDRIETWREPVGRSLTIKAWCHGDSDEMSLPDSFLVGLETSERHQLRHGVAFTTKRLTAGPEAGRGGKEQGDVGRDADRSAGDGERRG